MGFEEFDREGSKRGIPKIRISSNGQLVLNSSCISEYIGKGVLHKLYCLQIKSLIRLE